MSAQKKPSPTVSKRATIVAIVAALVTASSIAVAQPSSSLASPSSAAASRATVPAFDALFGGEHPGYRAVHARGVVVEGTFDASPAARGLTTAPHFAGGTVPIIVRFSNFAGDPTVPDGAPLASPRGMSVRFLLPDGSDTDIVAHSYDGFPAATPADFLAFLHAVAHPETLDAFTATRPAARAFLAAPKPTPVSYATEAFFGVTAFVFTNAEGRRRAGRYRFVPLAGEAHLTDAESRAKDPGFLRQELTQRLARAPVRFRLEAQLAGDADQTSDGSKPWPGDRPTIELGTLTLRTLVPQQAAIQRSLRFVPANLTPGISPSDDPMLLARTQAYRVSADRRGAGE